MAAGTIGTTAPSPVRYPTSRSLQPAHDPFGRRQTISAAPGQQDCAHIVHMLRRAQQISLARARAAATLVDTSDGSGWTQHDRTAGAPGPIGRMASTNAGDGSERTIQLYHRCRRLFANCPAASALWNLASGLRAQFHNLAGVPARSLHPAVRCEYPSRWRRPADAPAPGCLRCATCPRRSAPRAVHTLPRRPSSHAACPQACCPCLKCNTALAESKRAVGRHVLSCCCYTLVSLRHSRARASGLAAAYSPTPSPGQYHPRLTGLTAGFDMVPGGPPWLQPPTPLLRAALPRLTLLALSLMHGSLTRASASPYPIPGSRPLVPVRSIHRCTSTSGLSSWSSPSGLPLSRDRESHLGAGFPLRCFQRLSLPQLATRHCRWRDNRYTSAASVPVLSYWEQLPSNSLRPQRIETDLSHDGLNPARVPL